MATISKETTSIDYHKSIIEISQHLAKHGAKQVTTTYEDELPIGLEFCIETAKGQTVFFQLPCNWAGVLRQLEQSALPRAKKTKEQALRTGWRIIKDWVQAQMALIQAEMATPLQVFLPYAKLESGETFYEKISAGNGQKLLK